MGKGLDGMRLKDLAWRMEVRDMILGRARMYVFMVILIERLLMAL